MNTANHSLATESSRAKTTGPLFLIVIAVTAWLCVSMPVFAQESYYWTYAQHPDLSYFDHPPMVAWLIWLGTSLFGDGAIGIRLGTFCCGVATMWFGLQLLRDFGVGILGQRVWLLIGIGSPILVVSRVLANPDPALVCFWTLTLLALWRARNGGLGWWTLAGTAAGLALLSKYTAAFLAATGVLLFVFDERFRRQLKKPGPYIGVIVATLVFLPVLVWNFNNHFESFRFQTEGRFAKGQFTLQWLLQMISSQAGLLNPLLAVLVVLSLVAFWRRRSERDPRMVLLVAGGLPLIAYMTFQSLWLQIKVNWLEPAYVPLLLGVAMWWSEGQASSHRQLKKWTLRTLIWLPAIALIAPLIRLVQPGGGSSWTGWDEIAARAEFWEDEVDVEDGIEGNIFFFAADYRDTAQLGRSLLLLWRSEGEHDKVLGSTDSGEDVMAQNVVGIDALQYDHWASPQSHVGQSAIFVLPRPQHRQEVVRHMAGYFDKIEMVERVAIVRLGLHVVDADIYVCRNYRGPQKD